LPRAARPCPRCGLQQLGPACHHLQPRHHARSQLRGKRYAKRVSGLCRAAGV